MKDEILDYEESASDYHISQSISWWEKKRLLYNIFLFCTEIFVMISYAEATRAYGIDDAIFDTLTVNFIANIFYSMGWGIEILLNYYFRKIQFNNTLRLTIFFIGVLFSMFLAWDQYTSTLKHFSYLELIH